MSKQESVNGAIIDAVANHPAKLITLGVMGLEPAHYFSRSDLGKTVDGYQGSTPVWETSNIPFSYCANTLGPLGLVVDGQVPNLKKPNQFVAAYRINAIGERHGMPAVGAFLGWELEHPDSSIQRLFGRSNSRYANDSRAPSLRLGILQNLLAASEDGLSRTAVSKSIGVTPARLKSLVDWLIEESVVEEERKYDPSERIFKLSVPVYSKLAFNATTEPRPETLAAYDAAARLTEKHVRTVTGQEFLDAMLEVDPNLDPKRAWRLLSTSIASGRAHFIKSEDFANDAHQLTRLRLAEAHTKDVEDLVATVDVARDETRRDELRLEGYKILDNPENVKKLLQKSRDNSSQVRAQGLGAWQDEIVAHLNQGDDNGLNIDELYKRVSASGKMVSRTGFGRIVTKLVTREGSVLSVEFQPSASKIRTPLRRVRLRGDDLDNEI